MYDSLWDVMDYDSWEVVMECNTFVDYDSLGVEL